MTTDAAAWRFHIDHVRNGLYWSSAVGIDGDLSWIWTDHYDGDGSGDADSIVVDDGDVSGIRFWAFAGANERPTSRVGVARLTGIYPHPAHGMTTVVLETDEPAKLTVDVVDVLGRNARALADGFYYPGRHELTLNAASLPSGVYFVRMRTKGSVETRSFVVAR